MKTLIAIIFLFFSITGFSQNCFHNQQDTLDVKTLVIAYDMAGRLVTSANLFYDRGIDPRNDLCLPAGIYIIVIPGKRKSFKIGLV